MEQDLNKIKEDNRNIREINNKSSENLDKVKRQLSTSEQLLEKYENKLAEFNNRIPEVPANYKDVNDWHPTFLQGTHIHVNTFFYSILLFLALEMQKNNVEEILSDVKTLNTRINQLPNKTDFENLENATLGNLHMLKNPQIDTLRDNIAANHRDITNSINTVSANVDSLSSQFATNSKNLQSEIENLGKVEQVMVQTADSVLDTKRRVEYGVHQIIAEMQQLIKTNSKDVNDAISERFDTFEMSVLDEDNGALANLTAKIGQEIDQVWRQIGIMHQQMSASADTLNRLQNQTDQYVSGSLNVMDNMKGKV